MAEVEILAFNRKAGVVIVGLLVFAGQRGLTSKPWVKTSLAPGSQVVAEYLETSGLQKDLNKIGYNLVGYGCTSCIGNSGPLPDPVSKAVADADRILGDVDLH